MPVLRLKSSQRARSQCQMAAPSRSPGFGLRRRFNAMDLLLHRQVRSAITTGPTVVAAAGGAAPLVAYVAFDTSRPMFTAYEIVDGARRWVVTPISSATHRHRQLLFEFSPGRRYGITILAGSSPDDLHPASDPIEFKTPPLPADFPPLKVRLCYPERREPGYLMFNVCAPNDPHWPAVQNYRIALNRAGEVIFYVKSQQDSPYSLRNGHLLTLQPGMLWEIDLFDNIYDCWRTNLVRGIYPGSKLVDLKVRIHHAACELPDGNLVMVAKSRYPVDDYPSSELAPEVRGRALIVADQIVEIDRTSGAVVRAHKLIDMLDRYRVCYGSLKPDPQTKFPTPLSRDWSHANSVAYDPTDDSFVVSLRNQDAITKFDRTTGELIWILGPHDNWKLPWSGKLLRPMGPLSWPYHQHDVSVTARGTILCFDNGNYRASPPNKKLPGKDNYSRAVEFAIDRATMSIAEVWSYGGRPGESQYSARSGSVSDLPRTGNMLVNFGTTAIDSAGHYCDGPGEYIHARIVEVTRGSRDKVFELLVEDTTKSRSYSVYRCEFLPSLYDLSINPAAGGELSRLSSLGPPANA